MDPTLDNLEVARRLGVALVAGALLGLERERHHAAGGRPAFGGLRTFTLISLFGALSVWVSQAVLPWFAAAAFLGFAAIVAASHHAAVRSGSGATTTTEFAAFVAFAIGALAFVGRMEIAVAVAVVVTAVLSEKTALHTLATRLSEEDLHATLKFAILALVVFPLLPDRTYSFLGTQSLNLRTVWWMVVLISGVSFAGYVLMKWLGARRGIGLTGILGGLVSSTAVTASFARRSQETPALSYPFAVAAVLASAVAALRLLILVAVVNPELAPRLFLAVGAMMVAGFLWAVILLLWPGARANDGFEARNPFRLAPAIRFGLFFAAILVAVDLARKSSSAGSLYITGALAGLVNVDAVTVSMGHLADNVSRHSLAATTILLAVFANTLVKTLLAVFTGERRFSRTVSLASAAMVGAGAAGYWVGPGTPF